MKKEKKRIQKEIKSLTSTYPIQIHSPALLTALSIPTYLYLPTAPACSHPEHQDPSAPWGSLSS